ncbi:hypothetical protein COF63_10320 [Bacillus pseudomycoides]|nr:hypothetical protein CON86_30010 [Bacillus pseudomycoides]PEM70044.1 hypothetical protein CN632_24820 [Bacillus pseudomycoides]PHC86233.1 hypothetical protein COF63_10320 [Bacillus pseudomycoides]
MLRYRPDIYGIIIPSTYINSQNKEQPCYLLTRKDCDMVAHIITFVYESSAHFFRFGEKSIF